MENAHMTSIPGVDPGNRRTIRSGRRRARFLMMAILCLASPTAFGVDETPPGVTHALLINGGSKPASNYQSHLHHLEDMVGLLEARGLPRERIHIFSADGEGTEPDLAVRGVRPPGFWLIQGTRVGKRLRPSTEVTDTRWEGMELNPARKAALRMWFESTPERFDPGDRLLLFVTDHGTGNQDKPDNGAISLWQEKLTVEELKALLALLPDGMRTVMVMSQCYSGTFASAMFDDGPSEPSGGVCGFFSTARDLPAYGCYPEGRDRDRIGHAFRFIDALDHRATTGDAHLEVLITDRTPDVPLRTSDDYLKRLLAAEAESRGVDVDDLADELLAEAWRDRAVWEPEIRLLDRLGETFGTFSPRSLAELEDYESELPALIERMKTFASRWKMTVVSLKKENLASFLSKRTDWKERLADQALKALDAEGRGALLARLLPKLERFTRKHPKTWNRLEDLRSHVRRASGARWRLEVRKAVLRRMRSILIGVAGRVLLQQGAATAEEAEERLEQRQALDDLERCEALEPGELPAEKLVADGRTARPFPPLSDELQLLEEVLPSWLGVRFVRLPNNLRAGRELPPGATWLMAVYPDSPAIEAGLEAGDVILGPPERPFSSFGQLREWAMTSPRHTPLRLVVLRPGQTVEEDLEFEATLNLRPYPLEWPKLPDPPQVGEVAPPIPRGLEPVGRLELGDLGGRPHILFFWATWCLPCKAAVPEVLAFADENRLQVLAITDEGSAKVAGYLERRQEAFFERVAVDPHRRSFISYGVSGTPTIVLVDGEGVIRHRQVGYNAEKGLTVEGWSWSAPSE
jgi:thiol-disulfide isomerase/thioredoxin